MRPRPDVHPPPVDFGRISAMLAQHEAGLLSPLEEIELDALIEDHLARQGTAVVTRATARIIEKIEAGEDVTLQEIGAAMYSVWSGAISEYWQPEPIEPELEPT
jgi:hypothetical protein